MGDLGLCVSTCHQLGAWGEVLAVVAIVARWIWAEWKRRQSGAEARDLREQVRQLSDRPAPAAAVPVSPAGLSPGLQALQVYIPAYSLHPNAVSMPPTEPAAGAEQPNTQGELQTKSDRQA